MKRFILILTVCLLAISLIGCVEYDRDGDAGYVPIGDGRMPTSDTSDKGSAAWAIAKLVEGGQVVREVIEMKGNTIGAEEAYRVRTNGIYMEVYRFPEDSATLSEIKLLGYYPIKDDEGNVLQQYRAAVNGTLVLCIPTETAADGSDMTAQNDKLLKRFTDIKL